MQVTAALAGEYPSIMTARQEATYHVARKLAQTRGPLDSASFKAAEAVLGKAGVLGAVQQSAAFMYTSMMLNAADVCLSSGVKSWLGEADGLATEVWLLESII